MRLPPRLIFKPVLASATCALLLGVAPAATAGTTQITLSSCTGGWSIVGGVFSCTDSGTTPPDPGVTGAPSNCTISPTSVSLPATGGQVSVAASCAGTAATSWSWNVGGSTSSTTGNSGNYSGTVVPPSAITATPMNGSTAGSAFTVQVTAQSTGGGGTGGGNSGGGVGSCSGFTNTRVLVLDWNNPGRALTSSAGGFGANDAVVVQFTTGANGSPTGNLPKLVAAEYVSAPSGRNATLSDKPCDFGLGLAMGAVTYGATTVTMPFSVGPNNTGYYASLLPSTTYYLNIKNASGSTCGITGSCDMYIDLLKPGSGY